MRRRTERKFYILLVPGEKNTPKEKERVTGEESLRGQNRIL